MPKPQEGLSVYKEGKWRNKQGLSRIIRWVGQEGLGNPTLELEKETDRMRQWLQKLAPNLEIPVRGVVIFTHPKAELELDNPPVPALLPKQLKNWLRKGNRLPPLPGEAFNQLSELLNEAAGVSETAEEA
jgi:hypothetical protein